MNFRRMRHGIMLLIILVTGAMGKATWGGLVAMWLIPFVKYAKARGGSSHNALDGGGSNSLFAWCGWRQGK